MELDNFTCQGDLNEHASSRRHLRVGYTTRNPGHVHIPAITMTGNWLEEAGFPTGTEVDVRVMNGCLVITACEPEPDLKKALRRVEKLSVSKQKQIQAFIGMVSSKNIAERCL